MKSHTAALMVLGAAISMAVSAQDFDSLRHFQEHGVMDPRVSSETANSLVRAGIESGDPEAVDIVIRSLGSLGAVLAHDLPHGFEELPSRAFHAVPGLKRFLMEHWREQHGRAGGSTFEALNDSLGFSSPDGLTALSPPLTEWGLEVNDAGDVVDPDALIRELSRRAPSWPMIPQILSVYWPGDFEVEQFLLEIRNTDRTPSATFTALHLLNVGKFTSEAANAFRISQLESPYTEVGESSEVVLAVEGLALSRPVDALPALIEAGLKYSGARSAVLVAVAGYDDIQLEQQARQISRLVQSGAGVMPTDAVSEAYDRLSRLGVTAQ